MNVKKERFLRLHGRSRAEREACAAYVREQWPDELAHRLRVADEVVNRTFLFDLPWDMEQTAEPVIFTETIDWQHLPGDDPEFIYQLNRHRYWICLGQAYAVTGEEAYAECFAAQLQDWVVKNPITEETRTKTWRTIEAGLRAESWIKGMGYIAGSPAVTDEVFEQFYQALRLHGEYLAACDVPFSAKSNWGVLESSGLYAIGKVLEEEIGDSRLAELAKSRLLRQIQTQIMDDGVHWEQSPMYHNEVLKCCLEVLRLADRYGDEIPREMTGHIRRMAAADRNWQRPDGTQPPAGDSDVTDLRDVLTACAYWFKDPLLKSGAYDRMDYEGIWDYGFASQKVYETIDVRDPEDTFCWLRDSGNWYLRSGWGQDDDYLHVRCGSLGGGHGHFDKLHLDYMAGGDEFFTDPGRYTYVDGEVRRALKSSRSHNGVLVDGADYSACLDAWDVSGLPPAVNGGGRQKGAFTYIQCGHLGYLDRGIFINRRVIAVGTRLIVLADEAFGTGEHTYEQLFHIPPEIHVQTTRDGAILTGQSCCAELILFHEQASVTREHCRISRHYNQLEQGVRLSAGIRAKGNTALLSAIVCRDKGSDESISARRIEVTAPATGRILGRSEAEGIRITCGAQSYLIVVAHTDAGSDCEYIGACGCYGLGRVMAADLTAAEPEMTVLQW